MGINKPVMAVMAILVSVLVVATVAVPLIENAGSDINTTEQNTTEAYSISKNTETVTIEWSDGYKVNGSLVENSVNWYPKIIFKDCVLGINASTTSSTVRVGTAEPLAKIDKIVFDNKIVNLYSGSELKKSTPSDYILYSDSNGDYGLFNDLKSDIMIDRDSSYYAIIFGSYAEGVGALYGAYEYINGKKITDIAEPIYCLTHNGQFATTNVTLTINENKDKASDLSFSIKGWSDITTSDGVTFPNTAVSIIAPMEYHHYTQNDSAMLSILGIVPILLFLVPVFVAVAALKGRTD